MTTYIGIDYGFGQSNIDDNTGIRYGVISQNSVSGDALNDLESDYGSPHCPKCGNEVSCTDPIPDEAKKWDNAEHECAEFFCASCHYVFGSESAYPEEAIGQYLDDGEYKVTSCLDNDLMVTLSPYYTRAQFCSPCVPGAGNLDNPCPDGPKTYCLGHDWFDDERAPYPVYNVSDDTPVPVPDRPKCCDKCEALRINGVFCHETGCPNTKKVWDGQEGEWIDPESDDIDDC
jgi:hypothetical protein